MTDDEKEPLYEVGYGKPPRNSRFKSGESGNPRGKPKGAKNLATIVGNAIREKVDVTENGKRRKVSKLEVGVKQLVNKSASGDLKALIQLLSLVQIIESRSEDATAAIPATSKADRQTMGSIVARLRLSLSEEPMSQPLEPKETGEES